MARPSEFSPEVADAICQRIAEGESLRQICRDDAMPDKATVLRWLQRDAHPGFCDQYARARETQADALADEILEIADDTTGDTKLVGGEDSPPVEVVDHEHIARSKLRVDARKWKAGKLAPKKYGDRVINEHSGPGGGPIPHQHAITAAQVKDDLRSIFGSGAVPPDPAPAKPAGGDRVVHPQPDTGGGYLAGAPVPGEAVAGPERPVLPADGAVPPEGP